MAQVFYASPTDTFTFPNGAVGHRPGGMLIVLARAGNLDAINRYVTKNRL